MSSTTTTWSTDTNTKSGSATTYTDTVSSLRLVGGEGEDAILRLFADEGDDNADQWRIVSQASNNKLNFMSYASGSWSNVMSLFGSGTAASQYLALQAGNKLFLDGGGTTYLQESSDGLLVINSGAEVQVDTVIFDVNASGAMTLNGTTIDVDGSGAMQINSSGGTISIGNDDIDQNINIGTQGERTINIGTGSFADEVVIGNTTGASGVHLKAGTGDVQVTGNLGIGEASPDELLHITSSSTNEPNLILENTSTSQNQGGTIYFRLADTDSQLGDGLDIGDILFQGWNIAGTPGWETAAMIRARKDGATGQDDDMGGELSFWTTPDGSATNAQRMTIDNAGHIGIGTTTPGFGADGNEAITNASIILELAGTAADADGATVVMRNTATDIHGTQDPILGMVKFAGNDIYSTEDGVGAMIMAKAANEWHATTNDYPTDLSFWTTSNGSGAMAERMTIQDDGNVGIGITAPTTTLQVVGSFTAGLVSITATDAITALEHAGRVLVLADAGGDTLVTLTLPAATGTGNVYKFIIGIINTSNYVIKCANASDTIDGHIIAGNDSDLTVQRWTCGSTTDTITIDGTTTGGTNIGEWVELIDIATNQWMVTGVTANSGTEGTPFGATVS